MATGSLSFTKLGSTLANLPHPNIQLLADHPSHTSKLFLMGNVYSIWNDPAQYHAVPHRGSTNGAPSLTLEMARHRTPEAASMASLALNCWKLFPSQEIVYWLKKGFPPSGSHRKSWFPNHCKWWLLPPIFGGWKTYDFRNRSWSPQVAQAQRV